MATSKEKLDLFHGVWHCGAVANTPDRRNKDTKGASVIKGMRLERPLAAFLVERARTWQEGPKADVAATARVLMRMGAGADARAAGAAENLPKPELPVAGLRCDTALLVTLRQTGAKLDLNIAGAGRHLLRLALGYSVEASLAKEAAFAEIAEARKSLATAYDGG